MDYLGIMRLADNVTNITESLIRLTDLDVDKVSKFDIRYLDKKYWHIVKNGLPTIGWVQLYIDSNNSGTLDAATAFGGDGFVDENFILTNVSINISRTPTIIETKVVGLNSTVKQFWSLNDYDITITGHIPGPFYFQHDSILINKLIEFLNKGVSLGIVCPELELLGYNINKVVVYNYNIVQDQRFYQSKNFSIQLKSDDDAAVIFNLGENFK